MWSGGSDGGDGRPPAVSVVTIFLDPGPFLEEAIESVRQQSWDDWELLLVDDGSTDGSTDVALAAAAADPSRIRYLAHPDRANRGMSASRNLGVAHARGPVVAFLDGDDVFLPHKLEHHLEVLERHPDAGMVYGPMTLWWSWDPDATYADRVYPTRQPEDVVREPPAVFVDYLRGRSPTPATCSVLLRRQVFDRVGGFEERFTGMYEDQVFFYKVALNERIVVTGRPTDLYRQHEASTSARALATGEWSRRGPNPAHGRFMGWLEAYSRDGAPHARRVRREVRRARYVHRWQATRGGRLAHRIRRRYKRWVRQR